jgi:hypothetical protein
MFSGPCLVFCLALATGPSTASGQQTDRDFISVQTPFDEVEVTEASAFVKVMPWKDGEGVCTVIVSGDASQPADRPPTNVRLEFLASCPIIFADVHVSLELAGEYRSPSFEEPDLVYGHLRLEQADASGTSRYLWKVRGGKPGTEFVNVEWGPECRINGTYQGYGLRYHDGEANVSYDVDVSMTFEARFVVGSVFPNIISNWGCKDDPDEAPGE